VQKRIDSKHAVPGARKGALSQALRPGALSALPLALALLGCTPKEGPPPNTGGTPTSTQTGNTQTSQGGQASGSAPQGDPFEVKRTLREEKLPTIDDVAIDASAPKLPAAPKGLAPAPKNCADFVRRKAEKAPACADAAAAQTAVDAALAIDDPAKRDGMLAGLEACPGLPVGLVRGLRAELAPHECADALVEPVLKAPPTNIRKPAYFALLGQALAGRLARTATNPPVMAAPFERKRVQEFLKGPMLTWMTDQARLIEEIGKIGAELPFYARGVVAVEAGMADMRVVEVVRSAPVPKEIGDDEELRNVYYGQLDQQLEPRKDRGRDAALVGLRDFAVAGVIKSSRVDKARALLSKLYGGRRIDALDALLLPELPPAKPSSAEERLAAKLPTFAAGFLLDPKAATRPGTLRMLIERGLPVQQRAALQDPALSPEIHALHARAHLELGKLYWRASDFDRVIALTSKGARSPEVSLVLATSIALSDGPVDAAEMMLKAPLQNIGIGRVAALDAVAKQGGAAAGMAMFNAASILQIAAPQGAGAAYWKDVADRFQKAAGLLPEGPARASAAEHAKAAQAVASAIK
jgi:hypothetical protein